LNSSLYTNKLDKVGLDLDSTIDHIVFDGIPHFHLDVDNLNFGGGVSQSFLLISFLIHKALPPYNPPKAKNNKTFYKNSIQLKS